MFSLRSFVADSSIHACFILLRGGVHVIMGAKTLLMIEAHNPVIEIIVHFLRNVFSAVPFGPIGTFGALFWHRPLLIYPHISVVVSRRNIIQNMFQDIVK